MNIRRLLATFVLGFAAAGAMAQDKVVYHFDSDAAQALKGLRNMKNHLDVDPSARLTAVAHANGVDFLMKDAKDRNGNPYEVAVQDLVARGVKFEVCEITLKNRNLKKEQFIEEAAFTPSGVVRVAKLQREGAAYIKP
ncbi:DsrE family protein [uncultured Piscinibacter sp.]|uniref:DsrE family protein n=1 Tax=uncultured Piscinibacter sp. TaxID=1131835 RepID=UPI002609927A|nr:DsrE family protein [uncultured Piscinibacter sp.]